MSFTPESAESESTTVRIVYSSKAEMSYINIVNNCLIYLQSFRRVQLMFYLVIT